MTTFIKCISEKPEVLFLFGIAPTVYFMIMSVYIQNYKIRTENVDIDNANKKLKKGLKPKPIWGLVRGEKLWVHYIKDIILNGTCSVFGWFTLYILVEKRDVFFTSNMGVGESSLAIFLFLISIIGISGYLPPLVFWGKLTGFNK